LALINYGKTGRGVTKKEIDAYDNKNPFARFFEIFFDKYWKLWELNLLFILFCIPIFTIPTACIAMSSVVGKFADWKPVFLFEDFVDAFKENFKKGLGVFLIGAPAFAFLIFNIWLFSKNGGEAGGEPVVWLDTFTALVFFAGHFYIFPQIANLKLPMSAIYKNAFVMLFVCPFRTLWILFCFAAAAYLIYISPFLSLVFPVFGLFAVLAFISVFAVRKPIRQYLAKGGNNTTQDEILFEDKPEDEPVVDMSIKKTNGKGKKKNIVQ
jgi:uncharacterized membrane protein YesL